MAQTALNQAIPVSQAQLPLCCPRVEDGLWNQHPRIYLKPDGNGQATCPYCSAKYQLIKAS